MNRRINPSTTTRARQLRAEATPEERKLWHLLSRYRPKFTRQLAVGPYYADLACREARLIVEVDGSQHAQSKRDEVRTRQLEQAGWTIIRFWNSEVDENADGVAQAILLKAAECLGGTHPCSGADVPRTSAALSGEQGCLRILPSREGRTRKPRFE